jgi:hypothetical protein|tara:strand:+ start:651 stop:1625 length:975 start_codon:yes stop_codon:yes gene_type:complete
MDHLEDFKDTETMKVRPIQMHALLHLFLSIVFFAGLAVLLSGVAIAFAAMFADIPLNSEGMSTAMEKINSNSTVLKIVGFLSSSLPLLLACVFVAYFAKKHIGVEKRHYLLLSKPKGWAWFIYSLLFFAVCVPIILGPLAELNEMIDFTRWPRMHEWLIKQEGASNGTYEAMVGDGGYLSFILSLIFMALLPAISEELFFRGVLMNGFNGLFRNMHVSIFLTAIFFSLIHLQFMKAIPMFFLAVAFGYAAYWTGTIWTSIVAHFINNAFALYQLYFITDGDYTKAIEEGANVPMVVSGILIVLATALFVYIQKNSTTKTENFYV